MAERLVLGLPDSRSVPLTAHERSLRALVKAMVEVVHAEPTKGLIMGLAVVIEMWPEVTDAEADA